MHRIMLIVFVLAASSCIFGQVSKTPNVSSSNLVMARPVRQWVTERDDTAKNLILWSLITTRTPGGVVLSTRIDETRFKLFPPTLALRDVLDSLAVADPGYRWDISEGVVNLSAEGKHPALLDTTIAEFRLDKATARDMIDELEDKPEIRQEAVSLGYSTGAKFYEGPIGTKTFSVHCRNSTLRED